jgi:hypothetical protein
LLPLAVGDHDLDELRAGDLDLLSFASALRVAVGDGNCDQVMVADGDSLSAAVGLGLRRTLRLATDIRLTSQLAISTEVRVYRCSESSRKKQILSY